MRILFFTSEEAKARLLPVLAPEQRGKIEDGAGRRGHRVRCRVL